MPYYQHWRSEIVPKGGPIIGPALGLIDIDVKDADVVNLFRIQLERQDEAFFPSIREYASFYQINSELLKLAKPDAIVMNHIWPMYAPNPLYGARLKLDYCGQTISWFYPPVSSLQRVRFDASEMKRLEDPTRNRFIPFIGMKADRVRSPERVRQELEIAFEYGGGSLVWSSLETLQKHPEILRVVQEQLRMWKEKM